MDHRARVLIDRFRLQPHPEGGYYREIYRSLTTVRPNDDRPLRSAVTTIYFLLAAGQYSRWHRVRSDELWHFYEGEPLDLFLGPPTLDHVDHVTLRSADPVHAVPPDWWQATRPCGAYALAGCTVAPGFDFADFSLIADDAEALAAVERLRPDLASLV